MEERIDYWVFAKLGEKLRGNSENWKKSIFYKLDTHARADRKDRFVQDMARIANSTEDGWNPKLAAELEKLLRHPRESLHIALLQFVKGLYSRGEKQ